MAESDSFEHKAEQTRNKWLQIFEESSVVLTKSA